MALTLFCIGYYLFAGLAVNLALHRTVSHRSLRLPRWLERSLITLSLPAGTPIQWAGNHRFHHAHADQALDPHSPQHGFFHAHNGWYLGRKDPVTSLLYGCAGPLRILFDGWWRPRTNRQHDHLAPDVSADRYYAFVSRPLPHLAFAVGHVAFFFGIPAYVWGTQGLLAMWFTSVIVTNLGDAIDSLAHVWGTRPYGGTDLACNHVFMGLATLGEGWHANHHRFPWSAKHGLLPRQLDWTWMIICGFAKLRLAHAIRLPSSSQIQSALKQGNHDCR